MRIGIVGAGMAGLACAQGLQANGHEVLLFDKGRAPGGRMSTRRLATPLGDASFDHGAQYFTARHPAFRAQVAAWCSSGVAAPWPEAGPDAFVGMPAMNAPITVMAGTHAVLWSTRVSDIALLESGWSVELDDGAPVDVDLLVIATPAEQAAVLLAEAAPDLADQARAVPSLPCWTLMLAYAAPVAVQASCWRADEPLAWAARNSAKPGRSGPEAWVVQAGPQWSRAHLEADPAWVATQLQHALSALLGVPLPEVLAHYLQRWRYARSGAAGGSALLDPVRRIGVCGDWLIGPRVEAAWLSGTALAAQIVAAGLR